MSHSRGPRRDLGTTSRRRFLQGLAALGVGGQALLHSGDLRAAVLATKEAASPSPLPPMTYRTLGRTGHRASRLVFGCGAALARGPREDLLNAALAAGVNVFDVGTRHYYRDAEKNLGPFARAHRDEIFLISKSFVPVELEPQDTVTVAIARQAAEGWLGRMDESLAELGVDRVDAYYLMASNHPDIVGSDEVIGAFERAKQAGKVGHLGFSTHQNAARVLEAAIGTGAYSLAMIAVTPAGWYDWKDKGLLQGTPPMTGLRPLLDRARKAGIGLIGMKAGRYLAGRKFLGWGRPNAFDEHYTADFLGAGLSPFQRSYAYVLGHGLDAVNADMQSEAHLRENFVAAATAEHYFS